MKGIRRLAGAGAVALGAHFAIESLAAWNVRQEQKERAWLGDLLYSEVVGSGDPLVVLAGLQGSTRYWNHAFDRLANERRVIYLDALGFGRSPWPDPVGLEEHVSAIDRTLSVINANQRITFVAHSFGTLLAAYFAAAYPGRVRHLCLLGTPVYQDAADARRRIQEMSPMAALFSLNSLLARESCNLVCAARPLLKWLARVARPDLPKAVAEDAMLHHWPSIRGAMEILQHHPIVFALRTYRGRTTFVHGLSDTITPLQRITSLAEELGARVITVEGGHHAYVKHSDEIASVIL